MDGIFLRKISVKFGILFLLIVLVGCKAEAIPNSTNWELEDFSVTNQDRSPVSLDDYKGKVTVVNFIFTNCNDVCLPMTSNMSKLQSALKEKGFKDVELLSFSIDPTVDSPEKLKQFGDQFKANYSNWSFVTGYNQSYIEKFAEENFHMIVKKPEASDQVLHGTDFFLVNEEGSIVKNYPGTTKFPLEEILKHIKILQK